MLKFLSASQSVINHSSELPLPEQETKWSQFPSGPLHTPTPAQGESTTRALQPKPLYVGCQLVIATSSRQNATHPPDPGISLVSWILFLLPRADLSRISPPLHRFKVPPPALQKRDGVKKSLRGKNRQISREKRAESHQESGNAHKLNSSQLSSGEQVDCPKIMSPLWAWFINSCGLFNHREAAGERHLTLI